MFFNSSVQLYLHIFMFEDRNPAGFFFSSPRQEKAFTFPKSGNPRVVYLLGQKTWLDGFRHPWSSTYFDPWPFSRFITAIFSFFFKKSLLNCALLDSGPFLRAPFQELYVLKSLFGCHVLVWINSPFIQLYGQCTIDRSDEIHTDTSVWTLRHQTNKEMRGKYLLKFLI